MKVVEYAKGKSHATERLEGGGKRQKRAPGAEKPTALAARPAVAAATAGLRVVAASDEAGEANKVLFVENLPEATTETMLALLFEQFPGECWAACGFVGASELGYDQPCHV